MKFLRSKHGAAGLVAALVASVGLTLFVVLPALGASTAALVPSTSTLGIVPVTVPIGGNATCSNVFKNVNALPNRQTTASPSLPNAGTQMSLPSGNGDNVSFGLAVTNAPQNAGQRLAITSIPNVAIAAVAVNGGTNNAAYDYTGLDYAPGVLSGWASGDSNLSAPAKNSNQTYTMSHLTICYRLLNTISGKVFDASTGQNITGLTPGEVRIYDNTIPGKYSEAVINSNGTFSSPQPIGDSYTVCAKIPNGYSRTSQSVPAMGDPICGPKGYAPLGYTFTLDSSTTAFSNENFGFLSQRTISGQIYQDKNLDGQYGNSTVTPSDTALAAGWVVSLFDTTSGSLITSGQSNALGAYSFKATIVPNDGYKLCLSQPSNDSTTWVQTEPGPTKPTTSDCSQNVAGALQWAAAFTGGTSDVTQNFGNAVGSPCSNTTAFGDESVLALMPGTNGCLKQNTFAFANGVDTTNTQYVSIAAGDPTHTGYAPIVEKITFNDPLKADGTPTYTGLEYTAGTVTTLRPMQACTVPAFEDDQHQNGLLDPSNTADYGGSATNSDLHLNHLYVPATLFTSDTPGGPPLPTGETACLITSEFSSGSPTSGTLTAYVYSTADSGYKPL